MAISIVARSRFLPLSLVVVAICTACASPRVSTYQQWGYRLPMQSSLDDVSFLLGQPPRHCDTIEAQVSDGILIDPDKPVIIAVARNSPAAIGGMKAGERIISVQGVKYRKTADIVRATRTNLRWNENLAIQTETSEYALVPVPPKEAKQCYWEIIAGPVGMGSGEAIATPYGAGGSSHSVQYQRFFRATCRFNDNVLVECTSNYQE